MTLRETAADAVLPAGTDAVGRLFLVVLFAWSASAFGLVAVQVGDLLADVATPNVTTWTIAAVVGAVVGVAAVLLMLWSWRRLGGRRVMRLGRRVWRTGELPTSPHLRVVLLRELERREKTLRTPFPGWVTGVIVLLPVVLMIAIDSTPLNVALWALLALSSVQSIVVDLVDRGRVPELRLLIARLSEDTTGAL